LLKRRPLHFVFSEKTWAEVIDVNGNILLSKTNPGGSEQWIGGPKRAPYDITIGHPESVKLYYKGKEIDLSPYAGMETARLKVE
jgi:cytoskeleton protein RodZ